MIETMTVADMAAADRRHVASHAGHTCGWIARSATSMGADMMQTHHRKHCRSPIVAPAQPKPAELIGADQ